MKKKRTIGERRIRNRESGSERQTETTKRKTI